MGGGPAARCGGFGGGTRKGARGAWEAPEGRGGARPWWGLHQGLLPRCARSREQRNFWAASPPVRAARGALQRGQSRPVAARADFQPPGRGLRGGGAPRPVHFLARSATCPEGARLSKASWDQLAAGGHRVAYTGAAPSPSVAYGLWLGAAQTTWARSPQPQGWLPPLRQRGAECSLSWPSGGQGWACRAEPGSPSWVVVLGPLCSSRQRASWGAGLRGGDDSG